ncbi:hypothetical protein JP0089_14960 [Helicobacter pylori]|nr:hypothetical protein JP0089_14960 [Helicobacter pylori]
MFKGGLDSAIIKGRDLEDLYLLESGALKYQWTKFTLGTLYRNAPDRILGVKLPKALNEATAGAALKYHIKRALERSHSISDFSKQLELSAKNSQFTNNTLKIIEELNNGVKRASEELSKKASDLEHAITPLKNSVRITPSLL